jgi:hypothetical protein
MIQGLSQRDKRKDSPCVGGADMQVPQKVITIQYKSSLASLQPTRNLHQNSLFSKSEMEFTTYGLIR